MLNLIESLLENEQHIVRAEDLAKVLPNDGYLVNGQPKQLPPAKFGDITFEPCTLYQKKSMESVAAFVVKKGPGPYKWVRGAARLGVMNPGHPFIFTDGTWDHADFAKSVCSNLTRKFEHVHRNTLICIRNIPQGNPDRISHHIFKVVEVKCD